VLLEAHQVHMGRVLEPNLPENASRRSVVAEAPAAPVGSCRANPAQGPTTSGQDALRCSD